MNGLFQARLPIVTAQDPVLGRIPTCALPSGTRWGASGSGLEHESGGKWRMAHIYDPSDATLQALDDAGTPASLLVGRGEWERMRNGRIRGDIGARAEEIAAYRPEAIRAGKRERTARRLREAAGMFAWLAVNVGAAIALRWLTGQDEAMIAAVIATDAFAGTNGDDVSGRPLDTGGGTWTVASGAGTVEIQSNEARNVSVSSAHRSCVDGGMTETDAMKTTGTIANLRSTQGVIVRRDLTTGTHFMLWTGGGQLFRTSAADSGFTAIATWGIVGMAVGVVIALDVDAADNFEGFTAGSSIGTASDSTAGYEDGVGGLRFFGSSGMDDYQCETPAVVSALSAAIRGASRARAAVTGRGELAAAVRGGAVIQVQSRGVGGLEATLAGRAGAGVTLTGTGALTGATIGRSRVRVGLSGVGALFGVGRGAAAAQARLVGTGALSAASLGRARVGATFTSGVRFLTAQVVARSRGWATVGGVANLTASGRGRAAIAAAATVSVGSVELVEAGAAVVIEASEDVLEEATRAVLLERP